MDDTVNIRTHKSLELELKRIQENMKKTISNKFNGVYINVPTTAASQIAAKRLKNIKDIDFQIEKNGINRGKIRIL